ncbi:RNA-binding protein 43 isoform X2 [Eublepharis macularius]|uniref:RNA-binding protein 43 isoform X2 n=1 Tax=Eublepharis macularius TaxID=481883 RepID=A0AA97IYJ6_EUBMA|nr:RNA-binding protein 43 isoform X2 [Eublepharis macularius]
MTGTKDRQNSTAVTCTVHVSHSSQATAQAAKPQRTIVVYGIPDGLLEDDIMTDILMIHFQKAKNKGGDVEDIVYPTPTKGVAYITFEDRQENVLAKAEHHLQDKRLPVDCPLKVSLYGESVFICVSCLLDLSILREKNTLEDLVEDLRKNFTALSFGTLHSNGQITVQGPFSSIHSLQNKLALKVHNSLSKSDVKSGRKESKADHRSNTKPAKSDLSLEVSNNFVQSTKKEGLIVALDTDIYLYMKTFKEKMYQKSLEKCGVNSYEVRDGEITTIYLDNDPSNPSLGQLELAKSMVEYMAADLQSCLRKERLSLEGFSRVEKHKHEQACENVNSQYPHVLVLPYSTYIDIIGTSSDIYEFTQQVNKMVRHFQKDSWR